MIGAPAPRVERRVALADGHASGGARAAADARCFHCAEPVPAGERHACDFDGQSRALCCAGCAAIMQAILDAGLGDYYRHRAAPARFGVVPDDLAAALDAFAVYDEPEFLERHVVGVDARGAPAEAHEADACELTLALEGLSCGACVWLVERTLRAHPGVLEASCNFSRARAQVRYDPARTRPSAILGQLAAVGYRALPFDAREREEALARASRALLQRLFVAGIATMQVMMYALPSYLAGPGGIELEHERLLRWASLVLTTPVVLYSARPFFAGAWRSLRARRPNMDVPVTIGLAAAFAASVHATLTMRGEIWFDSVAMFAFLLLGARWLEWQARRRALGAVDALGASVPDVATRVSGDGVEERVPAARLAPGDRVRVAGGERVPADARVLAGSRGAVDLSLLSGESVPCAVGAGEAVPGGALVVDSPLELVVERGVPASAPSVIERLIERGASEKPRLVALADRIAVGFVATLLVFATIVFAVWLSIDPARALPVALATLVVSCPCALSLATPAALAAATGRLLAERLVVTRGHAIESAARVTDVVLDKTGTLTLGRPALVALALADGVERDAALALAVALERGSTHPFARAVREAAGDVAPSSAASLREVRHEPGHGVAAVDADGRALRLGSARWCALDGAGVARFSTRHGRAPAASSEVFLARAASDGAFVALARFAFVDPPRPEAADVVRTLRARGLGVHLLSGDRREAVDAVADALGIDARQAAATPTDKQAAVAALQREGRVVLMVGDGVNDAPVLALADVSLAVGDASALARTAADVIALAPGLDALPTLLDGTRRAMRVVRQNLAWAASYNALAIPAAALGLVPPWAAAVGMATSSLLVAGNALRLGRPPRGGR